jgi:hypothetical protein
VVSKEYLKRGRCSMDVEGVKKPLQTSSVYALGSPWRQFPVRNEVPSMDSSPIL